MSPATDPEIGPVNPGTTSQLISSSVTAPDTSLGAEIGSGLTVTGIRTPAPIRPAR